MLGNNAIVSPCFLLQRPQTHLSQATAVRMWLVASCAALAVLQSSLTDSFTSLTVALSAVASAVISELLFNPKGRGRLMGDGSAIASALVLTLLLPNHIHPLAAAMGACFAIGVVKYSFGGLGSNWMNPALGGWLFIRFAWPSAFDAALEGSPLSVLSQSPDGFFQGFPSALQKPLMMVEGSGGALASVLNSLDQYLTSVLNNTVFYLAGSELPGGYIGLLFSSTPGIIADRGLFALLLGTILITASQISRFWIPLLFLLGYTILARCFGAPFFGGGDMLFALFTGGTIAAAFFLIADPATGPKSGIGMAALGALGGVLAFILRYRGLEPYGACIAVALLNTMVPLVRDIESRRFYEKWRNPAL